MALLFMDSFDHYATADMLSKWTSNQSSGSISISAGNGRHSSASMRFASGSGTSQKQLTPSNNIGIIGAGVRISTLVGGPIRIMGFFDSVGARDQMYIQVNADGSITALRSSPSTAPNPGAGTALGSSIPGVVTPNTYNYIELKSLISTTVGTVIVRVNNVVVLNLTGQNTSNTGASWNMAWISGTSSGAPAIDFDDLYMSDTTGAAPWNDFLGDIRVDSRFPTAPGATTGWTPSTGANWQNVDDATPNANTDYNGTFTTGVTDTFTVQDSPVVGAVIYGVQHNISMTKMDSGPASIAPVIRHAGVDNVGANFNPGSGAYAGIIQINSTNPGTGVQWTEAGFNAAEFGYKRTA